MRIKISMRYLLLCCYLLINSSLAAYEGNRLFDRGNPVQLTLEVGKEVMLEFEGRKISSVGIKSDMSTKITQESIDNKLWLEAQTIFDDTRILVEDSTGKITIFIVNAVVQEQQDTIDHYVVHTEALQNHTQEKNKQQYIKNISFVDLTRFAAQTFYAPKRLIKDIGLDRVPLKENLQLNFSCNHFDCTQLHTEALASWSNNTYYVSAIKVQNTSHNTIILDPRDVIGKFITASFHFNKLGPSGAYDDTTVLYVISKQELEQSL